MKDGQTLTPKFSVMKFIITFNATGGTSEQTSKEVTYDSAYGDLPSASNTGYNFVGWYTDTEYTTQITKTSKVTITTNQTLYARWEATSFKVNFNSDGGSTVTSKTVKYNSNYGTLEESTKSGYNFKGWYLGENLITSSTKFTSLSDITLTAKWEVKKTTIIVEVNGIPTEVEIELNKPTIETLPDPEKEGYEFEGWYKDATGNEKLGEDEILPEDGSVKIYPKYKAKKYTVNFNANTGNVSQASKEVTFDEKYGDLPTPTKVGYSFTGWFTNPTNGTQVTRDTIVKLAANQTLYAHWSAKTDITYTIKHWQQNIGSNAESKDSTNYTLVSTETPKGTTDASVTPDTKTYTGFTSPNKTSVTVKADGTSEVNYYYTRSSYTLTVNKDNGVSTVNNKTSYQYGENVNITYTIKSGYTFKDITGDKTTNTFTMPASNVSVSINTTENTYTITYNLNGGSATNPTSYKVTSNNITLTNPTRTGYTFAGWTGSNGTTKQTSVTIEKGATGDKTYTANWNAKTFSVSFDANGGNAVSTVLTVTYDGTYGDTLPTPTRTGYTFNGWFTSVSGGTQVTSTTKVAITANQTLYAHWTIKSYNVTINKNTGGTISSTSLSINYGGSKTFTVTPSTGYYLSGLSCTNGYTTNAKTGTSQTAAQTVTVSNNSKDATSVCTVAFTPITYSISYTMNNGTNNSSNPKSYNIESSAITLKAPTRTGYTFTGWTGSNGTTAQTSVTIAKGSTGNKSYDANWSVNSYNVSLQFFSNHTSDASYGLAYPTNSIYYNGSITKTFGASGYMIDKNTGDRCSSYTAGGTFVGCTPSVSCTNGYTADFIWTNPTSMPNDGFKVVIKNNGNAGNASCTVTFTY